MPGLLHLVILAVGLITSALLLRTHVSSEHTLRLRGIEQHGLRAYYEAKSALIEEFFEVPERALHCGERSTHRGRVHVSEQLCGVWPHEDRHRDWHPYPLGLTTDRDGSTACLEPVEDAEAPPDGPVAPTTCRSLRSPSGVIAGNIQLSDPLSSCSITGGELVVLGYLSLAELRLECSLTIRAVGSISLLKITAPDTPTTLTVESSNGSVSIASITGGAVVYARTRFPTSFPPPEGRSMSRLVVGFATGYATR